MRNCLSLGSIPDRTRWHASPDQSMPQDLAGDGKVEALYESWGYTAISTQQLA
jgi:hypothetical protein